MTINKIKTDLAELKEALNVKTETPWDCKSLMMRFKYESMHREIYQKLCKVRGDYYEEPGPIQLHYSSCDNLSRQAWEFLKMSDEERAAAIDKEFPPKQYTDEEVEESRRIIMAKIDGIRERMRHDNTTA
jgi:hypothetical protein